MKTKQVVKSFLVIGMGRFGQHLALKLLELGNEVMVVDKKEEATQDIAGAFEDIVIGDCSNENVLRTLGVGNFDICFVTIGKNFEASLIITSLLKHLGAKHVVAKAGKDIQVDLLFKIGADEVVYPEREHAEKLAIRYNSANILDYIELTSDYSIYEVAIPSEWVGRGIGELDVRRKYKINILVVKNGTSVHPMPEADYKFHVGDQVVAIGRSFDISRLAPQL